MTSAELYYHINLPEISSQRTPADCCCRKGGPGRPAALCCRVRGARNQNNTRTCLFSWVQIENLLNRPLGFNMISHSGYLSVAVQSTGSVLNLLLW